MNALSAEALSRIRVATHAEWRASVTRPRPRLWLSYVAAVGLVVLALMEVFYVSGAPLDAGGEVAARLVQFQPPAVVVVHAMRRASTLAPGTLLRSGRDYRTGGPALFDLEGGGYLRVAAGSELEVLASDVVRLERGELYVDIPPGVHTRTAFIARTVAGEFRHLGTQYSLAVNGGETRLRVREGSVRWSAGEGDTTVEAGTEMVFPNGGESRTRPIATSGQDWDWIAAATPDFEIDQRPLMQFLEWVARESGRKLIIADDQARKKVATILMHGSVRGLTPMQALSAVMAATELRYDLPDGELRISFAGERPPTKISQRAQ